MTRSQTPIPLSLLEILLYSLRDFDALGLSKDASTDGKKHYGETSTVAIQVVTYLLSLQASMKSEMLDRDEAQMIASSLKACLDLQSSEFLQYEIQEAIESARSLLDAQDSDQEPQLQSLNGRYEFASRMAVDKCEVKKPAALSRCVPHKKHAESLAQRTKMKKLYEFFSNLDHMRAESTTAIEAAIGEAAYHTMRLREIRASSPFPQGHCRGEGKENDKYLDFIPITWTLPNMCLNLFCPPGFLQDMSILSMYVFLVDEYMEGTVSAFAPEELESYVKKVEALRNRDSASATPTVSDIGHRANNAIAVTASWKETMLSYRFVSSAAAIDRADLEAEIINYILHHITQLQDSRRLALQHHIDGADTRFSSPRSSYMTWLYTTGAGTIAAPMSFAFFKCYMGGWIFNGRECFPILTTTPLAHRMNHHIGTFPRMYNEFGSIARDRNEQNLNSVNFPEFFDKAESHKSSSTEARDELLIAAKVQRQCAMDAAGTLFNELRD